jgi:CheY-like chemotaxis protein
MFILTVEDEFLISEYLREILEGGGHEVIATFDADEAIEVLERVGDIQLVITDINMPGSMDGLRLAAAIRERWPPIRLIVVTGCAPPNRSELPRHSRMGRPKSFQRSVTSKSRPGNCCGSGGLCPLPAAVISGSAAGATAVPEEPCRRLRSSR